MNETSLVLSIYVLNIRCPIYSCFVSVLSMTCGTEQFTNFSVVKAYVFPVWLGIIPPLFAFLEVRKQFHRVRYCHKLVSGRQEK